MPRPLPPVKTEVSLEQFLEFETAVAERHEFVTGQVFAMAGTSERHNRLAFELAMAAAQAAREGDCRVLVSDVKLRTPSNSYQTLESLQAYVLLDQETPRAEMYRRTADGWRYERLETGGTLKLLCVNLEVALDDIYSRLN